MLTDEDRKDILNFVLKKIANIADKGYQERVWIRGEGPECDDFTETVCCFFSDADPIIEKYKEFRITDVQCHFLKEFRDAFDIFCTRYHEIFEFIDSPEWNKLWKKLKK